MGYYEKTLELMRLNDKIHVLKAKLYSLDGVTVSYISNTPRGKGHKGDKIGHIVANREELIAEIAALEKQSEPYIKDVRKALRACCNYDLSNSIESHRLVSNVIVYNYTVEEVSELSGKKISQIQRNIRTYLSRMKEREEKGTLDIKSYY
ncbi:hypothetical protein [Veillonella criceti]|uniref:Uncharacterized protein n=1 Tax=Veillonella criceti TaxID=103891 RepID=A0A380Q156_9FIRM|nr:hypothetical protein [Veillonella criceti]SUP44376.1 Uncharacterised protein [Veillonella criceti]SUP79493.1 Uncharacterised protein [Veillonella criceti]